MGSASSDATHRLTTAFILDLPIGRGRWIGGGMNSVVDAIVGGWSLDSFLTLQSGQPIAIVDSDSRLTDGNQRPNVDLLATQDRYQLSRSCPNRRALSESGLLCRSRGQHPGQRAAALLHSAGGRHSQCGHVAYQRIQDSRDVRSCRFAPRCSTLRITRGLPFRTTGLVMEALGR